MPENTQLVLLDYLNKRYVTLKERLTRMLGNADLAGDALHDTWLRLKGKQDERLLEKPGAYLVRMAINIAVDIQRREVRMLAGDEVDDLLVEMIDPAPGPEQTIEARSELAMLHQVMQQLPERRRQIFTLVYVEDFKHKEVAERLGISVRVVDYELKCAHQTLNAAINGQGKE
jgi:RNA polymerase sigma factor (sigma-70 family)